MNDENELHEQCTVFCKKKIPVHISKNDGGWLNGFVIEVGTNFIILKENKFGQMIIFFKEISKLETYTKEVGEDEKTIK